MLHAVGVVSSAHNGRAARVLAAHQFYKLAEGFGQPNGIVTPAFRYVFFRHSRKSTARAAVDVSSPRARAHASRAARSALVNLIRSSAERRSSGDFGGRAEDEPRDVLRFRGQS